MESEPEKKSGSFSTRTFLAVRSEFGDYVEDDMAISILYPHRKF